MAQQVTVFIGNQSGRFHEVAKILAKAAVNILSFNLADTADYGILRLIVDNTEKALDALRLSNITARLTDVLVVYISPEVGTLSTLLDVIGEEYNIAYTYPYHTQGPQAGMVLKVDKPDEVSKILLDAGYELK